MTKRKPGRPPTHGKAMTTLRVRIPQSWLDWLDTKGKRSEVVREIIQQAKKADEATG